MLTSLSSVAAPTPKISATAKLQGNLGGPEISSLTFGQQAVYALTANNLNLVANQRVTAEYTISVRPNGAGAPVILTGRLNLTATLPAEDGGAAKTTQEAASIAGLQTLTGTFTVPDSIPEGTATITVSLNASAAGKITVKKTVQLKAD